MREYLTINHDLLRKSKPPKKKHPSLLFIYPENLIQMVLRFFLAATGVDHPSKPKTLPYILDLCVHLEPSDSSPSQVFHYFINNWKGARQPHWIGDAGYGSADLLDEIDKKGGVGTFSISKTWNPILWAALSINTPGDTWRAATDEHGWIASSHTIVEKGKKTFQHIISSAFTCRPLLGDLSALPSSSTSTTPFPSSSSSSIPDYKKEDLCKRSVAELQKICEKYKIRRGRKKDEYVYNIMKRVYSVHQQLSQAQMLQDFLDKRWHRDPAKLHDFYSLHFNVIDLVNRRWHSVEEHHGHHHWQTKLLLAVLRYVVFNSWVLATKATGVKWKEWRLNLARDLIENTVDDTC